MSVFKLKTYLVVCRPRDSLNSFSLKVYTSKSFRASSRDFTHPRELLTGLHITLTQTRHNRINLTPGLLQVGVLTIRGVSR